MKKLLKLFASIFGIALLIIVGGLAFLAITEYKPQDKEDLEISGEATRSLKVGDRVSVLTYNVGYGGLSATEDFFMDGGKQVQPKDASIVENAVNGIIGQLKDLNCDVVFLQEVDSHSKRSFYIDEVEAIHDALGEQMTYAYNFVCKFIPYPFPPIGKVEGGLVSINPYGINEATRYAFPSSFKWPVSMCQLKRCIMVQKTPIEGSDKEMIFVNVHLEAYDDGEGKLLQTKILSDLLKQEYDKGNYIIVGGDFNQTFDCVDLSRYPLKDTKYFEPGNMPEEYFEDHWQLVMDDRVATSRLCNQPYDKEDEDTQLYMLDGFIVSDNISIEDIETMDYDYAFSDHNPVKISIRLLEE